MVPASIERRRLQGQSSDDDPTAWFPIHAWLVEREVSYGAHPAPGTLAQREFRIALAPGTPLGIIANAIRDKIADCDIHEHVSKLLSAGGDAQADFMVELFDTGGITCSFLNPIYEPYEQLVRLSEAVYAAACELLEGLRRLSVHVFKVCPENTGSTRRPVPTIVVGISDQHDPVNLDGALAHLEGFVGG
ncbi:hypothetical protein LTS01_018677 [Friedmanniomyces endolithicus]|nr:hypothetical protein LTS01_018677 [Friedmanniomyces endolithicus]